MVVCDVGFQMAGICSWLLIWCYICGFMIMGPDDGFLVSGSERSKCVSSIHKDCFSLGVGSAGVASAWVGSMRFVQRGLVKRGFGSIWA